MRLVAIQSPTPEACRSLVRRAKCSEGNQLSLGSRESLDRVNIGCTGAVSPKVAKSEIATATDLENGRVEPHALIGVRKFVPELTRADLSLPEFTGTNPKQPEFT